MYKVANYNNLINAQTCFCRLKLHTPKTSSGLLSQPSLYAANTAMATNGAASYAPVLTALATMQSNDRSQKAQAHEYLEAFQKSVRGWRNL